MVTIRGPGGTAADNRRARPGEPRIVTISTTYYGADAETIAGFITQPLEAAISQAQGIGTCHPPAARVSRVTAPAFELRSSRALTEINTKVASVRNQLPPQAQAAGVTVAVGQQGDVMYIGYFSALCPAGLSDYLVRSVKTKLDALEGGADCGVLGSRLYDCERGSTQRHGGAWRSRQRRLQRRLQQLPDCRRQHERPDGHRGSHGVHRSALG